MIVIGLIIQREIRNYREPSREVEDSVKEEIWTDITGTKDSESEEQDSSESDELLGLEKNMVTRGNDDD